MSPQTVYSNRTFTVACTQGVQGVEPCAILSKPQLTSIETAANGGAGTNIPVRFYLKTAKYSLKIRNCANVNCKLSIYDIITKRNTTEAALDHPKKCWQKGLTDFGGTPALTTETIGYTPYRSPEFNQYFGVKKVTTVSLEPGQQHDHVVFHKYNRVVDSIQFQNNVGQAIAGLTRWVMIVWHGTLVHDQTTPFTAVTYAPIRLDLAETTEYSFGYIEKTTRSFVSTNNVPTNVATIGGMLESGDVDANAMNS